MFVLSLVVAGLLGIALGVIAANLGRKPDTKKQLINNDGDFKKLNDKPKPKSLEKYEVDRGEYIIYYTEGFYYAAANLQAAFSKVYSDYIDNYRSNVFVPITKIISDNYRATMNEETFCTLWLHMSNDKFYQFDNFDCTSEESVCKEINKIIDTLHYTKGTNHDVTKDFIS